jgi:hypothetical protein
LACFGPAKSGQITRYTFLAENCDEHLDLSEINYCLGGSRRLVGPQCPACAGSARHGETRKLWKWKLQGRRPIREQFIVADDQQYGKRDNYNGDNNGIDRSAAANRGDASLDPTTASSSG